MLASTDVLLLGGNSSGQLSFFMSRENAERFFGPLIDSAVFVRLKDSADKEATLRQVKRLVSGTKAEVWTGQQVAEKADEFNQGPWAFLYLVLGLTVIISLLGVINNAAIGVLERRREIGLIKAVGGTSRQIRSIFLLEALFVLLPGALIGIAFGTRLSSFIITEMNRDVLVPAPFTFPLSTFALLLTAMALASIIGALLPTRIANAIRPVEALRLE